MTDRIACLATMPSRGVVLKQAVESLLPQVDELWIYLNRFRDIPRHLTELPNCHPVQGIDRGDAGKFFVACEQYAPDAFLFTCDDDLIYPPDYIDTLLHAMKEQPIAVGVHAVRFRHCPPRNYRGDRNVRHCLGTSTGERQEHLLGTGTLGFHATTIKLHHEHFETGTMADVWFAIQAQLQRVPLLSIARGKGWIRPAQPPPTDTLWNRMCANGDHAQVAALGRIKHWKLW